MVLALLFALQAAGAPAAERVGPGVLDTDGDEYGPTLTADGRTIYFTRRVDRRGNENIMWSRFRDGVWTEPRVAPFSGEGLDKEPYLSPDGKRLVFASRRPYPGKAAAEGEQAYDLFMTEMVDGAGWGEPEPLTAASSATYDNYPALAANGTLYFASHRPGSAGGGRNDLWRSRFVNGAYQAAEPLTALNTPGTDADPYIAPDERYIVFSSDRPGGSGSGDLYISWQRDGVWSAPETLGPVVNTADYEYTPWVSADGRWLYFSRGWGEMWRIATSSVPALKAAARE